MAICRCRALAGIYHLKVFARWRQRRGGRPRRPSRAALIKLNTNIPLARRRARVIGMQEADAKIVGRFGAA